MQFYNCLAIDPDSKNRMLLKQAMSAVIQFNSVYSVRNERIGLELLKQNEKYDLIFISDKIEKKRILKFIKEAKETSVGFLAGYILLCSVKGDAKFLADSMLGGIDGVLIEPYSIDSLQELSLLAAEVKLKREDEKRKMIFRFLVADVVRCLDVLVQSQVLGHPLNSMKKTIKGVYDIALAYEDESIFKAFMGALEDCFIGIKKPVIIAQECRYKGPSARIKRIEEKNLVKELETTVSDIEKDLEGKKLELENGKL